MDGHATNLQTCRPSICFKPLSLDRGHRARCKDGHRTLITDPFHPWTRPACFALQPAHHSTSWGELCIRCYDGDWCVPTTLGSTTRRPISYQVRCRRLLKTGVK